MKNSLMWVENRRCIFWLEEVLLWTFSQRQRFKVKKKFDVFVYHEHAAFHFTACYWMDWTCVYDVWIVVMVFYQLCELILVGTWRIHWWEIDVMLNFFGSVLMEKNKLVYILMAWGWIFGWTIQETQYIYGLIQKRT